ncbi:11512_t:CDS:2 [Dentiscutata erythropus]|uniref:11512_t:CDS:1 n=1 Tax=Dentiscutata erythropus TaxID=1348616 RepID=A0A9N8ZFR0_9GLOM|nr:11512_t:CDS:2 [Dentiscutata erythropus]
MRRIDVLLGDLPVVQREVREKTTKAQQFCSNLEETHKGKLEERLEGLFFIHDVLGKGAYKLRTLGDKVGNKEPMGII